MGVACDQLVVDVPSDTLEVEGALFRRQHGVGTHLVEEVTELLLQRLVARRAAVEARDRVEDLVGLLAQVPGKGVVCLLRVPRATRPERPRKVVQCDQRGCRPFAEPGNPDRRQVVRDERAVELAPGHGHHDLVSEAEMVEQHRLHGGRLLEGQLHVGEDLDGPALPDEERTGGTRCGADEALPVDQRRPDGEWVHTQPRPGQVGEGRGGDELERDVVPTTEQLDDRLPDRGRARHGEDCAAVLGRRSRQLGCDALVERREVRRLLVACVEAREVGPRLGRGVTTGPQPARHVFLEGLPRGRGCELGPRGSETNDPHDGAGHDGRAFSGAG